MKIMKLRFLKSLFAITFIFIMLLSILPISVYADTRDTIAETAYSQLGQHYLWGTQGEKFGEDPVFNSSDYPNAAYTTWYKENTTDWQLSGSNHFYCRGRSGQVSGTVSRPLTTDPILAQQTATDPTPVTQTINGESCAGKRHFDCSGLVHWVYNQVGLTVERVTASQYYNLCKKITRNELNRGDLVFLKDSSGKIHHVGIIYNYSISDSTTFIVEARGSSYGVVTRTLALWIATGETVLYGDLLSQLQPPPSGVGGIWSPFDKFVLLALPIGLASTILVATAIYIKRVKHRKEKQ